MNFRLFISWVGVFIVAGLILHAIISNLPKPVLFSAGKGKIGFGRENEKD